MPIPQQILDLMDRFDRNRADYCASHYNETELRRDFLDPFFEALGWDVSNRQGYAEAYRDVIHEDAIRIEGSVRAPDYCFRIGQTRKFFVEAKKPSVSLKDDPLPAFQLRRYAWSAKLSLCILSDFQEFAVYDGRVRPAKTDKPSTARVLYIPYTDYPSRWDEIASIFARDSIVHGSFDSYVEVSRTKKGTAEVDDAFLADIESWRERLAQNLALRNPNLSQREINFAVQMTLDRIIFLRICEDRGIESYGRLLALVNGKAVYERLCQLFSLADDRYNSGLFYFRPEKGRPETPDELTPKLAVDDKLLKEIIGSLYYPDSPYAFAVLPADTLGQVYERFLGKVIRLTPGHQAKVEEKPEVRKAGGVYYTPTYIVDYIVQHTVGKLLEGKEPPQVVHLRILDPACGSGSFLIGAYQYLLDWYREQYARDPQRWAKSRPARLYQAGDGEWRLTTAERKRILLSHLYGVDIDRQAVEVTKLSLLLKVLEGETEQTISPQLQLIHERALPDLGENIKCGNSLIGPDYAVGSQLSFLDDEEQYRVNAFDWRQGFPQVFAGENPGFDVVIGNPPYIRIQVMKEWAPLEVEHYKRHYTAAGRGNYDIYVVFVEKGLGLLNRQGRLGFILPHKFFNSQYGEPLRGMLSQARALAEVVHFGDQQVFSGATTYTCLLFLDKRGRDEFEFAQVNNLLVWRNESQAVRGAIRAEKVTSAAWNFALQEGPLFDRLRLLPTRLADIAERIGQGIRTSANEVYVLDMVSCDDNLITAHSKQLDRVVKIERGAVLLFLQGREIKSYHLLPSNKVVIMPYRTKAGRAELITDTEMKSGFPQAWHYLRENRSFLEGREKGRFRGAGWYCYGRVQNIDLMLLPKILVPDIADHAAFALDETGEYSFTSGYGITLKNNIEESVKYILGLLNSRVLDFYLKRVSTTMRGGFFRYFTQFIEQLPIRAIDFSDPSDRAIHDRMVELVQRMLDLHKQLAAARIPDDKERLRRQIAATDQQIDQLVYELYGLTPEEIKIVEEATR